MCVFSFCLSVFAFVWPLTGYFSCIYEYPEGTAFTLAFYNIHPSEHVVMENYGKYIDAHFKKFIEAVPKSAYLENPDNIELPHAVIFHSQKRVIKATGFDLFTDPDKLIHGSWRLNVFG